MASDDFPLINDHHAPTRHPDADSVTSGDYYPSYAAESDHDKSGSGGQTTPSSKRHHSHYYYNNNNNSSSSNKKLKPNGNNNTELESNRTNNNGGVGGDYRKDREEWSDTAISCLLEAYTEKYNQLNRGNLRGRDWEEVAEAVSERGGSNNRKSVEQCKNKIDNLKKRYKVELQRINNNNNGNINISGGVISSNWHWFKHIEAIMGNSSNGKGVGGGGGGGGGGGQTEGVGAGNVNVVVRQAKR